MPDLAQQGARVLQTLRLFLAAKSKLALKHDIASPEKIALLIDRLKLREQYRGKTIVDGTMRMGLWSGMVNLAVEPRRHLMVCGRDLLQLAGDRWLQFNAEFGGNIEPIHKAADQWTPYEGILNGQDPASNPLALVPGPLEEPYEELLLMVNCDFRLQAQQEKMVFQWLQAANTRDFFFRLGKVKLLMWANTKCIAQYFGDIKGQRLRAAYTLCNGTDIRLRAVLWPGNSPDVKRWTQLPSAVLEEHDPVFITPADMDAAPGAKNTSSCLLEVTPRTPAVDRTLNEYVARTMFHLKQRTVRESSAGLGHGFGDYLASKMPLAVLDKRSSMLTNDEYWQVVSVYDTWPFRLPDDLVEPVWA